MSDTTVPLFDPTPEIDGHWEEFRDGLLEVVRSGRFVGGPDVEAFEEEIAAHLGAAHAVGVNSGTDALVIGLRAMGIGPRDEVLTTPFTFFATAEAIHAVGAAAVFADVDPDTFNLDPRTLADLVTPRTRALLPVHLFGHASPMDEILDLAERKGLKVLEDTAQAFDGEYRQRKLGTLGTAGAFSFFPSKNLGGFGDGGMLVTDDERVAELARMLRAHGARTTGANETFGYNSRLDSLQAAALRVKLRHIVPATAGRRQAAQRYNRLLASCRSVVPPGEGEGVKHVYHQYTVRILEGERDAVREKMARDGISTAVYYPTPVHRLPIFAKSAASLPVAERLAGEVLSLPIWPDIDAATQERVVEALQRALA